MRFQFPVGQIVLALKVFLEEATGLSTEVQVGSLAKVLAVCSDVLHAFHASVQRTYHVRFCLRIVPVGAMLLCCGGSNCSLGTSCSLTPCR